MSKLILIVKCLQCGKWRRTDTRDIFKAQFTCFDCGKTMKLRNKLGWNVKHIDVTNYNDEHITNLVSYHNKKDSEE